MTIAPRAPFARWLEETNDVTSIFLAASGREGLINLAGGLPDPSTYPVAEISAISARVVAEHGPEVLGYGPVPGLPDLRDRIAARLGGARLGLSRENILITSGGMQALELVGKALLDEGAVIATQSPAYLGALDAWRPRGPAYRPVFPDRNGFHAGAALAGARFCYMVPNFSNPTGKLVGEARRRELVAAAQATGAWLVEDDPYGALYYDGPRQPTMLEIAAEGHGGRYEGPVVYLGTFSKEIAPGLRIGWVAAAPEMIAALTLAKQGSDMCTSGLTQRVAIAALDEKLPERMLPGILDLYRARRDALAAAMATHLSGLFDWEVPVGGMFFWAVAKNPDFDSDALMKAALEAGVCVSPSRVFDPEGTCRRAIRLNFTLNPPALLEEGVKRLAKAARGMV